MRPAVRGVTDRPARPPGTAADQKERTQSGAVRDLCGYLVAQCNQDAAPLLEAEVTLQVVTHFWASARLIHRVPSTTLH